MPEAAVTIDPATLEALLEFRRQRDWQQFHSFRNVATALLVEVAELLEIVQWTADAALPERLIEKRADIEMELADVAILLSYLVHDLGIDLDAAVRRKLALNGERYPVALARGNSRKYSEL